MVNSVSPMPLDADANDSSGLRPHSIILKYILPWHDEGHEGGAKKYVAISSAGEPASAFARSFLPQGFEPVEGSF